MIRYLEEEKNQGRTPEGVSMELPPLPDYLKNLPRTWDKVKQIPELVALFSMKRRSTGTAIIGDKTAVEDTKRS